MPEEKKRSTDEQKGFDEALRIVKELIEKAPLSHDPNVTRASLLSKIKEVK